jgi:diguanylate cyclase (GGDEF)-like protein
LTGLANRVLFLDHLQQALERTRRHRAQSLAVLFMDLDDFKVVNDSLGHFYGDQLLIAVGERLKATLRSMDTVARFGGDEFAVLLDELTDESAAPLLAQSVQAAIGLPFKVKEREVYVTASIGIATDAIRYDRAEDLLRDADLAMYRAKGLGKARSEKFALQMRDPLFSRLEMEDELRKGLKRHEFELYYQPIISLESNRIVGLEALLRWRHPVRGLLLPEDFLAVAEESGLILPLGDWVLNRACLQLKTWHRQYPELQDLTVSVNMSNREFSQWDVVQKVAAALSASGLQGAALRLEITERVLVGNRPTSSNVINEWQRLGVELELDDFGIAYSALAYLQEYPIHAIKIDKSFVQQMGGNRRAVGLVRAMVAMARELGLDAIAEGIETEAQLNDLKGLLCGFGQGSLVATPMDADSVGYLLAQQKRSAQA